MRWLMWNLLGCVLWLSGLAGMKGMAFVSAISPIDGYQIWTGLAFGSVGLALLMWANLVDA